MHIVDLEKDLSKFENSVNDSSNDIVILLRIGIGASKSICSEPWLDQTGRKIVQEILILYDMKPLRACWNPNTCIIRYLRHCKN